MLSCESSLWFNLKLPDYISDVDGSSLNDAGVDPAQMKLFSLRCVDELHRVDAKAGREFIAARVGDRGYFEHRRADGETRARRQVVVTQIQVDIKLVSCQRPAVLRLRDQGNTACIHNGDLGFRIWRSIWHMPTAALVPGGFY